MTEKVIIPPADQIEVEPRHFTRKKPGEYKPYEVNNGLVPDMVQAGDGYRFHISGLTHDERGYPVNSVAVQKSLVTRLVDKVKKNADEITMFEAENLAGADVVVISYGITSRVAQRAIEEARAKGIKVGKFRIITAWPFPEKQIRELAGQVKALVVAELNLGQMVLEVERCAAGRCRTLHVGHAGGGVHSPEEILKAIEEAIR
jgi:2-oxoglutarate ferredoxin oxidoreductase subunit alpha